jgi:hypothetical protein
MNHSGQTESNQDEKDLEGGRILEKGNAEVGGHGEETGDADRRLNIAKLVFGRRRVGRGWVGSRR